MEHKGRHSRPRRGARKGNARLVSLATAAVLASAGVGTLGASAAAASPAPQLSPAYSSYWIAGTVTPRVNGLRIRSGPGTNYRIYGLLYRGDRMWVITEVRRGSAYWCHVRLTRRSASGLPAGFTGWVYAPYLRRV